MPNSSSRAMTSSTRVEAVRAEVVHERGLGGDRLLLDTQLVHVIFFTRSATGSIRKGSSGKVPGLARRGDGYLLIWKPPSTARYWPVT